MAHGWDDLGEVDPVSDEVDRGIRVAEAALQMMGDRFINGDGTVSETGKKPREEMNRKGLVDGRDMGDPGEPCRLRRHPVRAPGMGMNDLNAMGADERGYAPCVERAEGYRFAVDRHGSIRLSAMEYVGNPKDFVSAPPGFFQ